MKLLNIVENFISIEYSKILENMELKNHFHNSHEIIYVINGQAEIYINRKIYKLNKGSIAFISNLEDHELKVLKPPYERFYMLIKPEYFQSVINHPKLASIFIHRPDNFEHVMTFSEQEHDDALFLLKKLYAEYWGRHDFWEYSINSLIAQLFVLIYRNDAHRFPMAVINPLTNTIFEIQKYIESHFTEGISLEDLSRQFYVNMYHLSRSFKAVTGFGFRDYVILQRLSQAKDLLLHTSDSVTKICMDSGFSNVNHFIRIFKKHEGVTPYKYRKLSR